LQQAAADKAGPRSTTSDRPAKRADVVLVTAGLVFVIELKVGSHHFDAAAFDQVVDYALDLKNFHAGSHDKRIVPIVVATMATNPGFDLIWGSDGVASLIRTNGTDLPESVIGSAPRRRESSVEEDSTQRVVD
jgi:hypothetical protein